MSSASFLVSSRAWRIPPGGNVAYPSGPDRTPFHPPAVNDLCRQVLAAMRAVDTGEHPLTRDVGAHAAFLHLFGTLPDADPAERIVVHADELAQAKAGSARLLGSYREIAAPFFLRVTAALVHPESSENRASLLAALGLPADPRRLATNEWGAIGRELSARLASPSGDSWPFDTEPCPAWTRLVVRQGRHLGRTGVPHRWTWFIRKAAIGRRVEWRGAPRPSVPRSGHGRRRLNRYLRHTEAMPTQFDLFGEDALSVRAHALRERAAAGFGYRKVLVRRASGKLRRLDIPDDDLAALQREYAQWLARTLTLPAEVMGFVPRRGVVTHARRHAGAAAAAVVDIADFFGSVRPDQVRLGLEAQGPDFQRAYAQLGRTLQNDLLEACFRWPRGNAPFLPQGAPSSPMLANLAARRLDARVVREAARVFGSGAFTYSRYADDLTLSTTQDIPDFGRRARSVLEGAIRSMGWKPCKKKSRDWREGGAPLLLCGIVVPSYPTGALRLPRSKMRELRALLHRIHSGELPMLGGPTASDETMRARGTLAWTYAVTGEPGWLAFGSRHVRALARHLGVEDPWLGAFCAGWLDAASMQG